MKSNLGEKINYHIVPPVFLVLFTGVVQILVKIGNPNSSFDSSSLFGNLFAWKFISLTILWALIWLWVPSKTFHGPTTSFGYVPVYKANGELYYFVSLGLFAFVVYIDPKICVTIYENIGGILGGLNILALTLCLYLLIKAKLKEDEKDPYLRSSKFPLGHEFYRGMELHPRILGVDVKQFTNCRVGLMLWQWLILTYFVASCQINGLDTGNLASTLLQTVYLYKFYRWETGYFNTLDITLDRAGYYICWGCLVWVPTFYTFHSFYFVAHPTHSGLVSSVFIALSGLLAIWYNYDVDRQKELFRTGNGNVEIWGERAKSVRVSYKLSNGKEKETSLLISGWWGVGRKINYTFELISAFLWCAPAGLYYSFYPFLYALFLLTLLIHRIFRDEDKCRSKYGRGWSDYCKKVPYRLIPYLF